MKRFLLVCMLIAALLLIACTVTPPVEIPDATPEPAPVAVEVATVTLAPTDTPEPTPEPTATPTPTPEPTDTPEPTATPTPTPTPEPTATPEPIVLFNDTFTLITPNRDTKITVTSPNNFKDLPDKTTAEIRLADGTVVGSAALRRASKNTISVKLPDGCPPRTTLYLWLEGTDYPIHTFDVAVLDKTYEKVRGNYEREDKMVAFTFDCAYGETYTDWLLDTLKKYNVHATFFMTGSWMGNHGPWIERMIAEGHELGSHSMTHPRLTEASLDKIVDEIYKSANRLWEMYGYRTHLFRPPYGSSNATIHAVSRFYGMEVIQWGQTAKDATDGWTGERILKLLKAEVEPGEIILCHNGAGTMKVYLPAILEYLIDQGYTFGTVSELMGWEWDDRPAVASEPQEEPAEEATDEMPTDEAPTDDPANQE